MKLSLLLSAVVLSIAFVAGQVVACDACCGKGNDKHIHGSITSVDGAKVTIKTTAQSALAGKDLIVQTDDKTAVTVDGKEAKLADLAPGMTCYVCPPSGACTKIVAKAPAAK